MKRTLLVGLALLLVAVGSGIVALRASLPTLDGESVLPGLSATVTVERDVAGVPTVRGRTRLDVARATGFLHAQDRFFQMDLMRRLAAGELAELVGAAAVEMDRRHRVHGLRAVARRAVLAMSAQEREVLVAYVDGVNAGIEGLRVRPPEFLLLRQAPAPWRAEDTVLAVHAMFLRLADSDALAEMRKGQLYECLPVPVAAFLASHDPEWAAHVVGDGIPAAALPQAGDFDLRTLGALDFDTGRTLAQSIAHDFEMPAGGSNAWVVAGSRTVDGRALVANDMHLPLGLPNLWYRMRLVVEGDDAVDVSGVTLPGAPVVVAGSNGRVAWGFTNSYGDWSDRVRVTPAPGDAGRYLTPDGPKAFTVREERIRVHGGEDVVHPVRETIWGPLASDALGRPVALRWTGHRPGALNLRLLDMERVTTVDEALALAPQVGIPPQNLTVGDDQGGIGWTIAGRIPQRPRGDATLPADGAVSPRAWSGWLPAAAYPRIVDPPDGLIWTANHPVVSGADLAVIGDSGYWHGARGRQIRDALRGLGQAREADMLHIQMDDRALLMARWKALLVSLLDRAGGSLHPRAAEFRAALATGDGRAVATAVDYRFVHAFRARVRDVVFSAITAPCRERAPGYRFEGFRQAEGPLWRLLTRRPAHLLHPGFADWDALLTRIARDTIEHFDANFDGAFAARTWGEHNLLTMRHPLSVAVPVLSPWLDFAPTPMDGDRYMPLVTAFALGASERFAVTPGREADGYLHMPGGQSGHFLSQYYRAGNADWVRGTFSPFLPGAGVHELRLEPERTH